jgi:hypothetical protein
MTKAQVSSVAKAALPAQDRDAFHLNYIGFKDGIWHVTYVEEFSDSRGKSGVARVVDVSDSDGKASLQKGGF